MAPGEAGTHHGCGDLSGVNGTPLLRGIEFTHAPAQAGERMAKEDENRKLEYGSRLGSPTGSNVDVIRESVLTRIDDKDPVIRDSFFSPEIER